MFKILFLVKKTFYYIRNSCLYFDFFVEKAVQPELGQRHYH
jgi:hypothetical protein